MPALRHTSSTLVPAYPAEEKRSVAARRSRARLSRPCATRRLTLSASCMVLSRTVGTDSMTRSGGVKRPVLPLTGLDSLSHTRISYLACLPPEDLPRRNRPEKRHADGQD